MRDRWWAGALALTQACTRATERSAPAAAPAPPIPGPSAISVADARHLLSRFAFGPTPGQARHVAALGRDAWLDAQLAPGAAPSPEVQAALEPHRSALLAPGALASEIAGDDWMEQPEPRLRRLLDGKELREHLGHLALAKITRHVLSERQLEEVLVDFWTDHFNVFARKGAVRVFAGDYIERAIRPHALGRFEDLLLATARHPAMLLYLDNVRSVARGAGGRRGLNENYARELLELHTLGVHGGYTQSDVTETARVLTGWSVTRPASGKLEFQFRERAHDRGAKRVLGLDFPAGGGQDEGLRLLRHLAAHPSTARHLAEKLCRRFVSDTPPAAVVQAAADAYARSRGSIAAVVRAIAVHDALWAPEQRGAKLKSPLELVVSSLRAVGARPDGTLRLARVLARLGQPQLLEPAPTGYAEERDAWLGAGALLGRMTFATALAAQKPIGARVDLDAALPITPSDTLAERAAALLFDGELDAAALRVVREETTRVKEPERRRALALALLLGGPQFQSQ